MSLLEDLEPGSASTDDAVLNMSDTPTVGLDLIVTDEELMMKTDEELMSTDFQNQADSSLMVNVSKDDEGEQVVASFGGGRQRKYGDEDPSNTSWTKHKKHFFILSSSGKPIYSKYGDESKLSSLMGIIQAMVSFVAGDSDSLKSITAGQHQFVFLLRGPIYLLAVAQTGETDLQLRDQLSYLYSHLVSVLTLAQITRIFQQRINYDLRNLLSTADNMCLDSLSREVERNAAFLLGSIQCLRLSPLVRAAVGQVVHAARTPHLLYAILLSGHKMITLVRPRRHSLHPFDLHLLFNMVSSSSSFRQALGCWTPICLPKFNSRGFLYVHVSYLEQTDVCLLLVSNDKDMFFELSEARDRINSSLIANGCLAELQAAIIRSDYSLSEVGIPGLRHFLYQSRSTMQMTMPRYEPPYTDRRDHLRLMRLYQHVHHRAHIRSRPRKIHYMVGRTEVVFGWMAPGFELYAVFGPLITKSNAITAVNGLLRWIKRIEDELFILAPPVF